MDPSTAEIYTLSLHDALPISRWRRSAGNCGRRRELVLRRWAPGRLAASSAPRGCSRASCPARDPGGSEEHTSELHSHSDLVCRLLLERKNPSLMPQSGGGDAI